MALDFRTDQLQVQNLIGVGENDRIIIYPQTSATDTVGGIDPGLSSSLLDQNIFFFVSGNIDSAVSGTFGTSVFGGDIVISGNLLVEGTVSGSGLGGGGSSDRIVNATSDSYVDADPNDDGSDKSIVMYSNGTKIADFDNVILSSSVVLSSVEHGYAIGQNTLLGFFDSTTVFSQAGGAGEYCGFLTLPQNAGTTNSIFQAFQIAGNVGAAYAGVLTSRGLINAGANESFAVQFIIPNGDLLIQDSDDTSDPDRALVTSNFNRWVQIAPTYFSQSIYKNITEQTAHYSASLTDDHYIFIDATGGPRTVTLPVATSSLYTGLTFTVKDVAGSSSINNITVQSEDSLNYKIDGANSYVLSVNFASVTLVGRSNGNWSVV